MGAKKSKRRRAGRTFYVLLLPYLAILLATLLASVLVFTFVGRRYNSETERLRSQQLNQLAVEVDYAFQYAITLGDSILFNPKLMLTARSEQLIYTPDDLRNDLQQADTQQRLVDFAVYLNNHDLFVTRGIQRGAEDYYTWYESLSGVSFEEFRQAYLTPFHLRSFMPPATLMKKASRNAAVIPYIQSGPLSKSGGEPDAQIILYLDARDIYTRLQAFAANPAMHVYLVYPGGQAAMQSEDAPDFAAWNTASPDEWTLDGQRYRVLTAGLGSGAAQLVAVSDYSFFYAEWNSFSKIIAILVAAYVAVGVLVAVLLARMNYRPIREINTMLGNVHGGNEYERIREAVTASISDRQAMSAIIEQQQPMVRESYLLRLLNGPAVVEERERRHLETLGISHRERVFYVLLCGFDMSTPFFEVEETLPDANLRCARIILENVGTEVLSRSFEANFVAVGRAESAFILSRPAGEAPGGVEQDILQHCDFLLAFALRECGLRITIGVSTGHAGIDGLPLCQDEARHTLNHCLLMDAGGCAAYGQLNPEETQGHFYYPADADLQLSGLLRGGRFEEARELIESLYEVNFRERNISAHAGRCFVYEVGTTVDRVLMSLLPDEAGAEGQPALGELLRRLGESISFADAKKTTLAYVEQCRELAAARRLGPTEQLVERIALFIDCSDAEDWLDLGSLADRFQVTPQYISHIFKKYKNQNIKDYISRHKLVKAKRYLRETDMTGEAISQKIGYASEAGLIRLFKKYEHTTPSLYRQASRG